MAGVELPTEQTQERKKSGIFFLWRYYHKKCVYSISQPSPQPLQTRQNRHKFGGRGVRKIIRKHDPVGLNGAYAPVV